MVGFSGTSAPRWLLTAARRGDIGSVILFGRNIRSRAQTVALTRSLQRAAQAGGGPGLLIATDQEGGEVKRIAALAPTESPPEIARDGGSALASSQGRATGAGLRSWGIDWDLAPVVDVPTTTRSFLWRQGRAFSCDADVVATDANAFATGLQARGVAATAKHFPGLGSATADTDDTHLELRPTSAQLTAALTPYRRLIGGGVDAVMASIAGFPAYDPSGTVAALSRPIITGLLRGRLGFGGVVITDSLGSSTGHDGRTAGVLAAEAGSDVLLYSDSAPGELSALRAALTAGRLNVTEADASYRRIVALKRRLGVG